MNRRRQADIECGRNRRIGNSCRHFGRGRGDSVFDVLDEAAVSAVNVAEVYTYAALNELSTEAIDALFADTGIAIVSFDAVQAVTAGQLASITRKAGLSLGNRSCLALAECRNAEVLTADRPWQHVAGAAGLTIKLLR